MDQIPTAMDPTKINLKQADLLRRLAVAPKPFSLQLDEVQTITALKRRGLVEAVSGGWVPTRLGQDVLNGGVVHTEYERQADGTTRLLVFLNGKQAGEVQRFAAYGTKGWQGIDLRGVRSLLYPRRDMAVAWVAGGAR